MPRVMTRCTETGREILTHLVAAPKSAPGAVHGERAYAVYCPICKSGHIIEPGDLWLEADTA